MAGIVCTPTICPYYVPTALRVWYQTKSRCAGVGYGLASWSLFVQVTRLTWHTFDIMLGVYKSGPYQPYLGKFYWRGENINIFLNIYLLKQKITMLNKD